jgi:hypothetical protein
MKYDLEIALAQSALSIARTWRDHGNTILLIGILAEVAIDIFWRDKPHTFSHAWREHFREPKIIATFTIGVLIFGGLMLEREQGSVADDKADEIRGYQQALILDAETRVANANDRIAKTLIALGPPMLLLVNEQKFMTLKQFAGTPYLVQGLPPSMMTPSDNVDTFKARLNAVMGSAEGVGSFDNLKIVGWIGLPRTSWRCTWMPDGIVIYSRHGPPLEVNLDTPEAKAWSAGDALMAYLREEGVDDIEHLPINDDANGNPTGNLAGLVLPRNGIFITIGAKDSERALDSVEREAVTHGPNE